MDNLSSHKVFIITVLIVIGSFFIGLVIITQASSRDNCFHREEGICEYIEQTSNLFKGSYQIEYKELEEEETINHLKWWYGDNTYEIAGLQNNKEIYRVRKVSNKQYVYNPQKNVWWEQKSTAQNDYNTEFSFQPESYLSQLIETSLDVKTQFRFLGKEKCNKKDCLWYEVVTSDTSPEQTYIYLDEETYKLTTILETLPNHNRVITFGYEDVSINKPDSAIVMQDSRNLILDILALQENSDAPPATESYDYVKEFMRQREEVEEKGSSQNGPQFVDELEN